MDDLMAVGASLSPWMRKSIAMLAREHMVCTCTSIGYMLTGRQSAYGWQTSAREGGRTLRALERRGLAFQQHIQPNERIFPWSLTDKGWRLAQLLSDSPAIPAREGNP